MVIIERLLGMQGDAHHILGLPKSDVVEWSNSTELSSFEVIRGVQFNTFSVSYAKIGLNFVECKFNRCTFKDLISDGHLWGAENCWTECVFEQCNLRRMIAPANSFKKCLFDKVSVINFKPHQTLFDSCSFSRSTIEGLRTHLISNNKIVNHDLKGSSQLLFRNCRFDGVSFRQCYFEGVSFQQCVFKDIEASGCKFEGIVSDIVWWDLQKSDPFTEFLMKALNLILAKCGRESAAYQEFEAYMIDYGTGKTTNKDFSACLYNSRVPYAETQKVINDLRKLVASFPF